MSSETFHYKRGANQQFCQMSHVFDPSKHTEEELLYNTEKEVIPIAIHCVAEEGTEGKMFFYVLNSNFHSFFTATSIEKYF